MKNIAILAIAIMALTFIGCATTAPQPAEPQWVKSTAYIDILGAKTGEDGNAIKDKDGRLIPEWKKHPTKLNPETGEIRLLLKGDPLWNVPAEEGVRQ